MCRKLLINRKSEDWAGWRCCCCRQAEEEGRMEKFGRHVFNFALVIFRTLIFRQKSGRRFNSKRIKNNRWPESFFRECVRRRRETEKFLLCCPCLVFGLRPSWNLGTAKGPSPLILSPDHVLLFKTGNSIERPGKTKQTEPADCVWRRNFLREIKTNIVISFGFSAPPLSHYYPA